MSGRSIDGKAIAAGVRAAPEQGEANAALEKLLAKALGVAKTNVKVARGATARLKTVEIAGVDADEVAKLLERYAEKT